MMRCRLALVVVVAPQVGNIADVVGWCFFALRVLCVSSQFAFAMRLRQVCSVVAPNLLCS